MKKRLATLPLILLVCSIILCFPAFAGSVTTVSSLMEVLNEENKQAVYDINLNAPFSKESSGIRENISSETGELILSNEIINIPGRNGNDLSLNLVYSNRDAKLYEEGTKSATISQNYGQTVVAFYDVYDSNNYWLRTGAFQYTTSDTQILGSMTVGSETWVFNGYLQYLNGTSILKSSSISNNANPKSKAIAAKNIFGEGWSLDMPSLDIDGNNVCVSLLNGQTYIADFSGGCGLKNYTLYDVVFTRDTTKSNGIDTSAYKLYYVNGNSYYYSSTGELILESDRFNNTITYYWETIGGLRLLTKIIDTAGHMINIQYNDTQTIFTYGNNTIKTVKTPISGETGKYYLSSVIDSAGRITDYSYTFQEAAFDSLGKTAVNNKYANLVEASYPSGLKTCYTYEKSTKNLGSSGYMEYFKVKERYDTDKTKIYNDVKYLYYNEPDGYPQYKVSNIDVNHKYYSEAINSKGLTTKYLYNSGHQLYLKQQTNNRLLNETLFKYYDKYNLPIRIENRTYNENGDMVKKVDTYGYDFRGNVIFENHPDEKTSENSDEFMTTYSYDYEYNLLTSKKYKQDKNRNILVKYVLTNDKKTIGSEIVYSNGNIISNKTYGYDAFGNITSASIEKQPGEWVKTLYKYSSDYNHAYVTSIVTKDVKDADGNATDISQYFTYDFNTGNKITETDGNGNITQYKYDSLNRILKKTTPDGLSQTYTYDDRNNATIVVDANKNSLKYYYDGLGNMQKVIEPKNNLLLAKFEYDENGNRILSRDGNKNNRLLSYDALNRITSVVNRDKNGNLMSQTEVSYNEAYGAGQNGRSFKISVKKKGNDQTLINNYYFDVFQRLIRQETVSKDGIQTALNSYDYLGNNTVETGTDGQKTYNNYDAVGNVVKTTDALGNASFFGYDAFGNLISATDALGNTTFTQYDALGRKISEKIPYESGKYSKTKYYYDGANNLIKQIDPEGYVTKQYYTSRNFLYAVEKVISENKSNIEKISYDGNGKITQQQTGLSSWDDSTYSTTEYKYDSLGRQVLSIDASGRVTRYGYDNNGNMVSSTDRNGVMTYYAYDGLNRMVEKYNSKDGEKSKIRISYDLLGNTKQVSDESGITTYDYDGFGRLKYEKDGSSISKYYTYDNANRVSGQKVMQGSLPAIDLAYAYDSVGRLTSVNNEGKRFNYSYDPAGRLIEEQNGMTGIISAYTYYPSGNVKSLIHKNGNDILATLQYKYDARGYQTQKDQSGSVTSYYYDPLGRIKTAFLPNEKVQDYSYDDMGNIKSLVEIDGTLINESDYVYDKDNRLLYKESGRGEEQTQETFAYDAQGNLISKEKTYKNNGNMAASENFSYYYNGYNQLSNVLTPDNDMYEYIYNSLGLRTKKECDGGAINYCYDASGSIILETDEQSNITARNIRGQQLIYRQTEDETYGYLHDAHGDIIALTDEMGNITKDYSYDPFGNEDAEPLQGFGQNSTAELWRAESEKFDNPFGYCGEYYDKETGMIYLRARYYDPATSRMLTEDSYPGDPKDPLSLNLYTYCHNNPVNLFDPSGHIASSEWRTFTFALRHPIAASKIGDVTPNIGSINISTVSARFSTNDLGLEENSVGEGSQVNAFRHALWQSIITMELGQDIAVEAGNVHEENPNAIDDVDISTKTFSSLSEADESIDLANNIIGRGIGSSGNLSRQGSAIAVLNYYHENGLWVAQKQSDGTYRAVKQKLSDDQYNNAYKRIQQLDNNGFTDQQRSKAVYDALRNSGT